MPRVGRLQPSDRVAAAHVYREFIPDTDFGFGNKTPETPSIRGVRPWMLKQVQHDEGQASTSLFP